MVERYCLFAYTVSFRVDVEGRHSGPWRLLGPFVISYIQLGTSYNFMLHAILPIVGPAGYGGGSRLPYLLAS